jgi:hypothetical protein
MLPRRVIGEIIEAAILGGHVEEEAAGDLTILGQTRLQGDDRATRPKRLAKTPPLLEKLLEPLQHRVNVKRPAYLNLATCTK